MPGSKENARANDLRVYLNEHMPETILISSKPYDKGARLYHRKTGRLIMEADSNGKLLELLTRPGAKEGKEGFALPIESTGGGTKTLKDTSKIQAEQILCKLKYIWELGYSNFKILMDPATGEPMAIKTKTRTFTL